MTALFETIQDSPWLLDLILMIFMTSRVIKSRKAGFVESALGFLPLLVAWVGTRLISPIVCRYMRGTFFFGAFTHHIRGALGLHGLVEQGGTEAEIIRNIGLPDFLTDSLLTNNNPVIYRILDVNKLADYVAGYIGNICFNIVGMLMTFAVLFICARFLINALNLAAKLPGLNALNHFWGGVLGGVKGLFLVWLLFMGMTFIQCNSLFGGFFDFMERARLTNFVYENNLLLYYLMTVFT